MMFMQQWVEDAVCITSDRVPFCNIHHRNFSVVLSCLLTKFKLSINFKFPQQSFNFHAFASLKKTWQK